MNSQRLHNIDLARGIAMLIVISWHTLGFHSPYTDIWTMPIFFFIMGVFYKQPDSFKTLFKKKGRTLIRPAIAFSIPTFVLNSVQEGGFQTITKLVSPYDCLNGVTWFVWCTIECYVIIWILHKTVSKDIYRLGISASISALSFYLTKIDILGHHVILPLFISTALTSQFFVTIGELAKDSLQKGIDVKILIAIFAITIFAISLISPMPNDFFWNKYGTNWITLVVLGSTSSFCIISFLKKIPIRIQLLEKIGALSLPILLVHPFLGVLLSNIVDGVYQFLTVAICSLIVSVLIEKYWPYVLGKNKKR